MRSALIGHTGFVGGNLAAQFSFTDFFNSKTIGQMAGQEFDLVVCSGARAEKWKANQDPAADREALRGLTDILHNVRAREFILISTVDVFRSPVDVDESTAIDTIGLGPYGLHRYELEQFCQERFDTRVVRLPGLFGPGLKKNIIYDFLNNNQVDKVHADSVYQFYDLTRLWSDVSIMRRNDIDLVHLATPAVSVADVAREAFGFSFTNRPAGNPARYDFQTRHSDLFNGTAGYIHDEAELWRRLKSFVATSRTRAAA
jgi:nucleoside-diphosphate-sugar epimerase